MAVIFKHIEIVGRLANIEEIKRYEEDNRTPVFINKPGDIQYKVMKLSTRNSVSEEQFIGYISTIRNLEFVDDQYASSEDRIKAFSEFYSKSLFVFSYKIDTMGNSKIDIADIVPRPSKIDENSKFIAIPCFSSKIDSDIVNNIQLFRTYESYEQFVQILREGKSIGRIYNFQIKDNTNFPEFIIWYDKQRMCAIGPIKAATCSEMDNITLEVNIDDYCEISLDEEDDDTIEYIVQSGINPTLIHIAEGKYLDIINRMSRELGKQKAKQVELNEHLAQVNETIKGNIEIPTSSTQQISEIAPYLQEQSLEDLKTLPSEKNETAILDFFRFHSQKNKLFYYPKDITNFHTAIKTGNLVILSGMSGTGKSALVDTYAKALGISKNVLMIPVRPSWNDDSDLLGYVDLIHMVYRASDTGFINKIVEASENKDDLYLICLDEMNLARVEHYFSQFLSIMEKPVGARELVLYDKQYSGKLYNSAQYPSRISIGDNVKFIGTVNVDESTYHFSDKVLDRANVISLEVLDYSNPGNWKEDKYRVAITPEWSNLDFNKLVKKDDVIVINQHKIRGFLWAFHSLLHSINTNLGVGPRIVKSIEIYLRNLPECDAEFMISEQEGLDFQVAQRILTKVRGPEEQLKELFNSEIGRKSALILLLDNFSDISEFKHCRKLIEKKEKELKIYGYCL